MSTTPLRPAPLRTSLAVVCAAAALTGCARTELTGTVTDVTGEPMVGAMVTVVGQPCQTLTDEAGAFTLPCASGTYTVTVGQAAYISETFDDFEATEKQTYDLGEITLIKLPTEKGLLVLKDNSYTTLERGWLVKDQGGKGTDQYRHYCLPEAARTDASPFPANPLPAGNKAFFDNDSDGWRPWRLDDQGCAYRMSPTTDTQWGVDYAEKATIREIPVAQGQEIVIMTLEPGEYFISDWGNGFFNKTSTDDPKVQGYGGWYVVVE